MTLWLNHSTRQSVILTRIFDYAALCYNAANTVYFIPMRLGAALLDVTLLSVMRHFTIPP